ncbi:bifunctional aspartate transaminase/aspartate 4-decarboxylase [Hamadaea tsunoensis]|uniref:bifunctional aspartate transaminase/aspartate 4-decarboxylase n=1 Tax=Hamadaea tsunoensis TaxID=53368 RepID=UPI0004108CA8|nr:bifunctional aspartate transaminase/aspartate 4-decarboxylase [Hamadaea tsunoensis]
MTTRAEQKRLEGLSPFELKNSLIELADENVKLNAITMLNAGRGNPNWIATEPREAFFLLGRFGIAESRLDWDEWDGVGGMPQKKGIGGRFDEFIRANAGQPGADMLGRAIEYGVKKLGFDKDAWVWELTDSVIGDHYPEPDRMLSHVERVVHAYLVKEMCGGRQPDQPFDLYAVEGGTAAMCYLFDSAVINGILNKGDTIAIMTPIFTPYLEIPHLERYRFDVVELQASRYGEEGFHTWQYDEAEIEKLADPKIKAVFLVNPSNPPSVALAQKTRDQIKRITETSNPGLTIITDDVYGTFVDGFESLMSAVPRNTIGVYSFSKYFGCTGWRLGVIAVNRDNIFEGKLAKLPARRKAELNERYSTLSLAPEKIKFIDRIVADSRQVALNHTAGLSLPQQVQMAMFSLFALLDEQDDYKQVCQTIIMRRMHALTKGMGVTLPRDPAAAHYYVELDLLNYARRWISADFAEWLEGSFEPVDPVFRLAEKGSVVLLNGGGFDGPEWSVRVSLANLRYEAYEQIGSWLREVMEGYFAEFQKSGKTKRPRAAAKTPAGGKAMMAGGMATMIQPAKTVAGKPPRKAAAKTAATRPATKGAAKSAPARKAPTTKTATTAGAKTGARTAAKTPTKTAARAGATATKSAAKATKAAAKVPAKKVLAAKAPAKKTMVTASPAKKTAAARKAAPAKKTAPANKTAPAKKAAPMKKAVAKTTAKKTAAKKAVAKKR